MAGLLEQLIQQNQRKKVAYLGQQGIPMDAPASLMANPEMARLLAEVAGTLPMDSPAYLNANPTMAQLLSSGPAPIDATVGATTMRPTTQTPALPMGGNANVLPQQVKPAVAPASAPTQGINAEAAQALMAEMLASQGQGQASPQDINMALTGGPANAQEIALALQGPATAGETPWYQNRQGMDFVADVLAGIAAGPNWVQGSVAGADLNEQRTLMRQQQMMQRQAAALESAKTMSDIESNSARATRDRAEAANVGKVDPLEQKKTEAEIKRIQAETKLAQYKAVSEANPDQVNVKDYNRLLVDLRGALAEGDALTDEGSEELFWSPDYRARIALNQTAPQAARYIPISADVKARIKESRDALNAGTLSRDQYNQRVQQAAHLSGPDAILDYIKTLEGN